MTIKKRNRMRAILIILLVTVIHLGNRSVFAQGSVLPEKRILVLLSLEANRPIQLLFNSTFRQEMNRRSFHPHGVNYENLDLARFRDKNYKNNLKKILDQKYSVHQPDIIIIYLPHAARFVAEYNLFPGIPKIYITPQLTNKSKAPFPGNSVSGSFGLDFRGNVKHSLELFPDTNKMFVVRGEGISDKGFEKAFKKSTEEFTNQIAFEYIRGLEVEKLLSRVENLPDHSLIYYLTYSEDTLGRRFHSDKIAKQLGQRANRPVFGFMDLLVINTGILGGRVISVESIATWTAEVIWRVFKGEDINSIEDTDFGYKYLYNWPKIKKWGLNERRLPPNSVIYHRKYTFFELYKWQIFGGVLLLLLESLLIIILFANISTRKKGEAALRESEQKYRFSMEATTDGLWDWTVIPGEVYYSPSWSKMLGEIDVAPEYDSWENRIHLNDKEMVFLSLQDHLKGKTDYWHQEHRLRTRTGKWKWVLGRGRVVERDENDQPLRMVGTMTDISQLKQIESQLRQAQKMESIGTLAGGIAHDFNNILQSIIINTEMALHGYSAGTFEPHRLEEVLKGSQRAADLVKQILTFSRQSGRELYPLSAGIVIKEALKMLRSSLPTTVEIKQKLEAKKDIVLADPTQIHQIMMNLCTNAAHAMREKGGLLEVSLRDEYLDSEALTPYHDLSPGDYLRLRISDTGHGISTDVMERIFDPFFTTKEPGEGTGMGLAVVHGIIKSLGGDISVDSVPEKGTTFVALLPMAKGKVAQKSQVITPLPKGNEHILFVDDEKATVDAIRAMLESLGYKVTARTSSIECLEAFRVQPANFELVITDMTMPNMTGEDLAKEIKNIRPDVPIILCTGFSEMIDENKATAMGIRKYIMKPIVMADMAKLIRDVLDEK